MLLARRRMHAALGDGTAEHGHRCGTDAMPIVGGVVGIPLLAPCALVAWLVLRARGRAWVIRRSGAQVAAAVIVAALPWIALHVAHGRIQVNVHSVLPFIGFVLAALCVFAVLVLIPLAVLLACVAWLTARRRPRAA